MEKLEKVMGTKWVLFVVSALIAAFSIGQDLHLSSYRGRGENRRERKRNGKFRKVRV